MVQRRMIRKNNRIRMVLERIKKQTAVRGNRNLLEEEQKTLYRKMDCGKKQNFMTEEKNMPCLCRLEIIRNRIW